MEKPNLIRIGFSTDYRDKSLSSLKAKAADITDEDKNIILDYLGTNLIRACPGMVYDIFDENCIIGRGDQYTDGKHIWPDYLSADIRKYNIPIPEEFREYILKHHKDRKKRHLLFKCTDHVKIKNEPRIDRRYEVQIFRNGNVIYKNHLNYPGFMCISIPTEDAAFIINPVMEQLFCCDEDNHGSPMIDGYHWEIEFYTKKGLSQKIEGWPGENEWRRQEFRMILKFAEQYIHQCLGTEFLECEKRSDF